MKKRKENKTECYVYNCKSEAKLPLDKLNTQNTLFYPEKTMTLYEQCTSGRPRDFNIVTDSPFLVGLYAREEIWMYDTEYKRWVHPNVETYGASFDTILFHVFNYTHSIAGAIISSRFCTNVMGHPLKKK